ncbi:MAG: RNA pseudouridine synthase [Clostridia bacterium]|jgi:23S rRNA pseudouridine1911/1915/1917 synthase|nr:RNA pseudouridine synthase [Clostridia bacterium]
MILFLMVLNTILTNYGINRKIRIVNRLDKDTSGIVIFAKNEYVQEMLSLQMKDNTFKKEYIGILERYARKQIRNYKCQNFKERR